VTKGEPPPLPRWEYPPPFGRAAAVQTMTSVAAPLLAGFSIAVIGVVAQAPSSFRLPGVTLTVLTVTAVLLVACIQVGFRARAVLYSKGEIDSWWPEEERKVDPRIDYSVRVNQNNDYRKWLGYHKRARQFYNLAIISLAFGISTALIPPLYYGTIDHPIQLSQLESIARWVATGLAACAGLGETAWWISDNMRQRKLRRRHTAKKIVQPQQNHPPVTEKAVSQQKAERPRSTISGPILLSIVLIWTIRRLTNRNRQKKRDHDKRR
jgi:hypothetical protein